MTRIHHTHFIFALLFSLFQISCASTTKSGADVGGRMSDGEYESLIKKNTRHDLQYDGFYNKFEVHATFINTEVQTALLQKMSDTFSWKEFEAQKERDKMFQENAKQTKFALSFFVPSVRLNDLHKGTSIWKIYLEVDGERYDGRTTRRNGKLEDIQAQLPYHNRWSVPYDVAFNIPLSGVEGKSITLVITSSQGTSRLSY